MAEQAPWQRNIEDKVNYPSMFPARLKLLRWVGRQTWIPRGRERILRLGCSPGTCKPYPFEVDFFGLRYRGTLSHYLDWNVFMYGSSSYNELSLLQAVAGEMKRRLETVNFFDIGANAGHHTLFMSPLVDRIFAFEPFPAVRALLEEKISLNNISNVEVLPVALGLTDEELSYFPEAGRNPGSGTLMSDHGDGYADAVKVSVRNGDRLFDERALPRLDLLKIDTEGFEPLVLRGLSQHIRKDRPVILTEIGEFTRRHLHSELAFNQLFYEGAIIVEVSGRAGCRFKLSPFKYATANEVAIFPPDWADFLRSCAANGFRDKIA